MNKYTQILNNLKFHFENGIKNNDFLNKLNNSNCKGKKELFFILYIKNQINIFKKNNKPYVLPSCRTLAKILNCSKSWIACLINKYQNLFNFENWTKQKIKKAKIFYWKYKKNFNVCLDKINLFFKKINMFIFKTKKYFKLIKNLENHNPNPYFFEINSKNCNFPDQELNTEDKELYCFED